MKFTGDFTNHVVTWKDGRSKIGHSPVAPVVFDHCLTDEERAQAETCLEVAPPTPTLAAKQSKQAKEQGSLGRRK